MFLCTFVHVSTKDESKRDNDVISFEQEPLHFMLFSQEQGQTACAIFLTYLILLFQVCAVKEYIIQSTSKLRETRSTQVCISSDLNLLWQQTFIN